MLNLIGKAFAQVWLTFTHNWYYLALGALVAALMKLYVQQDRVAAFLRRHRGASVLTATAAAVGTPLCSCGTTAIILGMMASSMPWAPVVAFMVASPLTSPQELFYSAGLFGWPFAGTFFAASVLLGLAGGLAAYVAENRGWLQGQARFRPVLGGAGAPSAGADLALPVLTAVPRPTGRDVLREFWLAGRRLLLFFLVFAFIGYLLNGLIPQEAVGRIFGSGKVYGVPLAATLGLPFYINTEASLPLVRSFMDMGMSPGATLAFLITGAGTSIGAITGALTIARWRVVGLVVGTLWVGAVAFGYLYDALVAGGLSRQQTGFPRQGPNPGPARCVPPQEGGKPMEQEYLYGGIRVGPEFAAGPVAWLEALQAHGQTVREPELDRWVTGQLPLCMAERWQAPYLKRAEILRIADWTIQDHRNQTPGRLEQVDPLVLERSVRAAFIMRAEPAVAVQKLTALRAVGLTVASAILAACFPAEYAILSEPVLGCVPGLSGLPEPAAYAAYVGIMRLRAAELSAATPLRWTPRMGDQALYVLRGRRAE